MTDYEWLTSMGLCHKCRKEKTAPGKKHCFECLERIRAESRRRYDPIRAREYQSRRRELYRGKISAGICVRCKNKATHGLYCYECSIKEKRRSAKRGEKRKLQRHDRGLTPEQRKENGQCLWCGAPAEEGVQCCSEHRSIFSNSGKKGYEANLTNKNNPWINEVEAWKKKNNWTRSESI